MIIVRRESIIGSFENVVGFLMLSFGMAYIVMVRVMNLSFK